MSKKQHQKRNASDFYYLYNDFQLSTDIIASYTRNHIIQINQVSVHFGKKQNHFMNGLYLVN